MPSLGDSEKQDIEKDFDENVNMTKSELEKWLSSDDSKSVGVKKGTQDKKTETSGSESTGHEMGGKIVTLLGKNKSDLTDSDYETMKKVNGYINRHSAQKPSNESIDHSRWRYSLMNWGNDPTK